MHTGPWFDKQDLFTLLDEGWKSDEIAASFTDSLNSAMKQYKEEKSKSKKEQEKITDFELILEEISNFFHTYYPKVLPESTSLTDILSAKEILTYLEKEIQSTIKLSKFMGKWG